MAVLKKTLIGSPDGTVSVSPVDVMIHKSVRAKADTLYRARILVWALAAEIGVHLFLFLALMFAPFFAKSIDVALPINLGSLIAMAFTLFLLKRHGLYSICCGLTIAQGFIAVVAATVLTGGPHESPATQLLGIPCLMAFFFGGLYWGLATAIISLFTLILTMVMQLLGFPFPQMTPASVQPYAQSFVLPINFAVVAALSLVYEMTSLSVKRERDREHRKFEQLARTDPLTGLANRRIFDETLAARIVLYGKLSPMRNFALCYLDLDKFKPINDQFGHDTGDEVLNAISMRLRSALRGADFIGRHGGDEFMMLLDSVHDTHAAEALAQRFLRLIEEPIETSAGSMQVGGSFGFALFPQHGVETSALQKAADEAMYEAKRSRSGFKVCASPANPDGE